MIKCNFYYNSALLNMISNNAVKSTNLITDICAVIMLICGLLLIVLGNTIVGAIALIAFVLVVAARFVGNSTSARSNRMLLNQQVKVLFNRDNMNVVNMLGDKELAKFDIEYTAIKKVKLVKDLIYIYIENISVIVVPKTGFATQQDYEKAIELVTNNYSV